MWKKFSISFGKLVLWIVFAAATISTPGEGVLRIAAETDAFTTDHLGNIYAIKANTIAKYDRQGSKEGELTMTRYDRLNDADASDPFKILIFNRTAGEIARLDNRLSLQGEPLSLFQLGAIDPERVCNSWDDGIWIFDRSFMELIRINQQGTIDLRSGNLSHLLPDHAQVSMIREHNFTLLLASPDQGLFLFDRFANLIRRVPETNIHSFQTAGNKCVFVRDNKIYALDVRSFELNTHSLPNDLNYTEARIGTNLLYIRNPDKISVYPINFSL
jgi:hypothetical protein